MKKVEIILDDNYADVLTFTAIGFNGRETNATVFAMDLAKNTKIVVGSDGKKVEE